MERKGNKSSGACACMLSRFSCDVMDLQPARLLCPRVSLGKNTGVGRHALSRSSQPRDRTHISSTSPALVGGFFTTSATWEAPQSGRDCLRTTARQLRTMDVNYPSAATKTNRLEWGTYHSRAADCPVEFLLQNIKGDECHIFKAPSKESSWRFAIHVGTGNLRGKAIVGSSV